jgi:hypothetical protein
MNMLRRPIFLTEGVGTCVLDFTDYASYAGFYACCFTILAREIHLVELFYKTTIGKIIIDIIDA